MSRRSDMAPLGTARDFMEARGWIWGAGRWTERPVGRTRWERRDNAQQRRIKRLAYWTAHNRRVRERQREQAEARAP